MLPYTIVVFIFLYMDDKMLQWKLVRERTHAHIQCNCAENMASLTDLHWLLVVFRHVFCHPQFTPPIHIFRTIFIISF